jgi:2-isopropylmalate synthase
MTQPTTSVGRAPREISIFDTTLRDGEQAPANAMTPEQKLDMAIRLEALGVAVVEVGFPASSTSDFKAARLISGALQKATVATFSRSVRADIAVAVEAAGVERHQVQLLVTASDLHLEYKRGIARSEAVREAADAVQFASSLGVTDISIGLEDSSRGAHDLLRALIDVSVEAGATTVVFGDTSGCMLPEEFGALIGAARGWVPKGITLATHCHNDMGLALANALAGISAGADQVQTTLGGVGERSGNTALEELAAVLTYKGAALGAVSCVDTTAIYDAYLALKDSMRLPEARNKAIVGSNAFATAAGIHQAGVLQRPETYEYLDPATFGRERHILVSRHSGTAILRYLLTQRGMADPPQAVVAQLYSELIASRQDAAVDTLGALGLRVDEWLMTNATTTWTS